MRELIRKQYKSWTSKEEEALAAGVHKYGSGNWKTILKYSKFARYLARKSCGDLWKKWRTMAFRVSNEKLKTMSPKVKKVVAARLEAINDGKSSAFAERKERGITGSGWTVEEEEALAAGVEKYGTSKWKHILEDPEFGPVLAIHPCTSLANKWRNLTDSVSEEKLRRMSCKVREVMDASLRSKINDDQGEETERVSKMEEDTEESTMSTKVRKVVDDEVQNSANPNEAVKETERVPDHEMVEEDETLMMDVESSADPAEAVKENERILKMKEDAKSMLLLAKEIWGHCSTEGTNRVSAPACPQAVKESKRISEIAEDIDRFSAAPPPQAEKKTKIFSEMEEDTDRGPAPAPPKAVEETKRVSETAEDTKSMLLFMNQIYERFTQ
ncbi:single myb histone 4-like [Rosa chinensis]|uniref:single myb histone 4-like n=1 Tax=Rosa chinensis TaxID=74649 RepID=UPI000D090FF2|nr:single myb histone 4-like [Rosa chinensis]